MFLGRIDFVDEAINMRCNNLFNYAVSKTGLLRDARNDVNFKHAAYMYLKVLILNWFGYTYINNREIYERYAV